MSGRATLPLPFGDARYASLDEVRRAGMATSAPDAHPLGMLIDEDGRVTRQAVGYPGERHGPVIFGANGSGKSLRLLVPMLLNSTALRSFFVLDPTGELAAITAPHRAKFGPTYVINPFGLLATIPGYSDLRSCRCNPLRNLSPGHPSFNRRVGLVCEAIIAMDTKDPYWSGLARNLMAIGIMAEVDAATREGRPPLLSRVRDWLTDPRALADRLKDYARSNDRGLVNKCGPLLQEAKSIRDVISEAARQTEWLDDEEIAIDLAGGPDEPDFATMRDRPTTIYLILPAEMMVRQSKWLRLMVTQAITSLLAPRQPGQLSVTMILEEFYLLTKGGLSVIEDMMAFVRKFGIQFVPVLQDQNQLIDLFPKLWQTFLSNSGVIAHVGAPSDLTTSDWISRRAGETTALTASSSMQDNVSLGFDHHGKVRPQRSDGGGMSWSQTRVPFLPMHRLLDTPEGRVYLWRHGVANTILTEAPLCTVSMPHPLGLHKLARANPYFLR